jgi:hypothetical protein
VRGGWAEERGLLDYPIIGVSVFDNPFVLGVLSASINGLFW